MKDKNTLDIFPWNYSKGYHTVLDSPLSSKKQLKVNFLLTKFSRELVSIIMSCSIPGKITINSHPHTQQALHELPAVRPLSSNQPTHTPHHFQHFLLPSNLCSELPNFNKPPSPSALSVLNPPSPQPGAHPRYFTQVPLLIMSLMTGETTQSGLPRQSSAFLLS